MALKAQLHQACDTLLQQRLDGIAQRLQDLRESLTQETKSSVGDKYETSRAMVHLEQEKLLQQQGVLRKQQQQLQQIKGQVAQSTIQLGSLVKTNKGHYYLSVPLGKVLLDGQSYYALSLAAPLGKQLLGNKVGATVEFNGQRFELQAIL